MNLANTTAWVAGILGLTLPALKLTGVIGWSWWWVTAPVWGSVVLYVLWLIGMVFFTDYSK